MKALKAHWGSIYNFIDNPNKSPTFQRHQDAIINEDKQTFRDIDPKEEVLRLNPLKAKEKHPNIEDLLNKDETNV